MLARQLIGNVADVTALSVVGEHKFVEGLGGGGTALRLQTCVNEETPNAQASAHAADCGLAGFHTTVPADVQAPCDD